MKKNRKVNVALGHLFLLGMLAAVLAFGLLAAGCDDPNRDDPDSTGDPVLSGTITISPSSGVTTGTKLTATYSGSESGVIYQWKKDGTAISGGTGTIHTPAEAGNYTVIVSATGYQSITSVAVTVTTDGGDNTGNGGDNTGNNQNAVWRWSNQTAYTVTDGVATAVYYAMNPTYTNYVDEDHFSETYSYTIPNNTVTETDTYTMATIGSMQAEVAFSRNGNTSQIVSRSITNNTTTLDYVDPRYTDTETTTSQDITSTSMTVFDVETGLTVSSHTTQTGTSNGSPINSESETNYTLQLLSTDGDVKTYKVYDTATGGTGTYTIYKLKGKVTLETKSYTAGDVLSYTATYTFPENTVIRERLPTFTLSSYSYVATPSSNNYQTCEVIANTASVLTIRIKTFNYSNVLTVQSEMSYSKV